MTAAAPAGCAANTASSRRAIFAIAWSPFRRTSICSGSFFNIVSRAGRGLAGHSFGNLFLTALTNIMGDFPAAVQVSAHVLAIRGRIFPSTAQNVTLEAELEDGAIVAGETKISRSRKRIRRVRSGAAPRAPVPEVLEAIRDADLILVGPGSLYTSIIPNLAGRGDLPK